MSTLATAGDDDPFRDGSQADSASEATGSQKTHQSPALPTATKPYPPNWTLTCGRNASLTLGEEALVVLDEGFAYKAPFDCCGLLGTLRKPMTTRAIPYYNILWAEYVAEDSEISIRYAHHTKKTVVRVVNIHYAIDKPSVSNAAGWIERLFERAYGQSQKKKRIKVLINPFGGKGSAVKWYGRDIEPIFAAARCEIDVERTKYSGHAAEIAEELDISAWDVIACCSGDGIPYEVFNGFARRPDAAKAFENVAVVQLPCGSGNAMSLNLNGTDSTSVAALVTVKGLRTRLDLVSITQGDRRTLSFLSQAVGIIAESDLGTDHLRWMGSSRFTYGFLTRLLGKTIYPADVAVGVEIDDKTAIRDKYRKEAADTSPRVLPPRSSSELPALRYGTINDPLPEGWELVSRDQLGNFYAGNMAYMAADTNFFAASLPSDGCLDLVTIDGDIPRLSAVKMLFDVENGRLFDNPSVSYRKVSGYRISPKGQKDGYISIDGEKMPFEPFQAEVHRGLGCCLSKSGRLYEVKGV